VEEEEEEETQEEEKMKKREGGRKWTWRGYRFLNGAVNEEGSLCVRGMELNEQSHMSES